jgi:hypothetical protein
MSVVPTPAILTPDEIDLGSEDFRRLQSWPFADAFVTRILTRELPLRIENEQCRVWL